MRHLDLTPMLTATLCAVALACAADPARATDDDAPARDPDLAAWLQAADDFWVLRSPITCAYRGIPRNQHLWDAVTDLRERQDRDAARTQLTQLARRWGSTSDAELAPADALDARLYEWSMQRRLDAFAWHTHDREIDHMRGLQNSVPSLLTGVHQVATKADAENWIARVRGVWPMTRELIVTLEDRRERGIRPLKTTIPRMLTSITNTLRGRPFEQSDEDSVLLADIRAKVAALELPQAEADALIADAEDALQESFRTAMVKLRQWLIGVREEADDHGAWSLPDGDAYYAWCLRHHTTTDMGAEEIHTLGLEHIERIHGEMRAIMEGVGFEGDLPAFFEHMRTHERFFEDDTSEGRAAYLARVQAVFDDLDARLDELFAVRPQAELVVRRVEAFREASVGKAFYSLGAADGSRPGVYYVNLRDMSQMPLDQLRALAYHEGLPGHHMQLSIAQELDDLAQFRRYLGPTAYVEGWALYTEELPAELGFYADPYEDFGRLAMELWRAARLVVDTGLHHHRWSRARAIGYLKANTPNADGDCVEAVDRYLAVPGQATAYMVGKLEIQRLRARAEAELGDVFDVRAFYDVVLGHGALPLDVLGELVEAWIARTLAAR